MGALFGRRDEVLAVGPSGDRLLGAVEQVIRVLFANGDKARALLKRVVPKLGPERTPSPLGIERTLDTALITAPEKRDPELFKKLDAVAGRVLNRHN